MMEPQGLRALLSQASDKLRCEFWAHSVESAHPSCGAVRFGVFEVDLGARELRKQGVRIKLQEQPFHLLQMLLEHPGEVVTREELQKRIWPVDTFVDFDQGLNNAIKRLREALCDSADSPRYIETVPRHGYRFIGMTGTSTPGRIRSLAVLPLENLSHDPQQEYFAEGLTEALITTLAKIGELRVVSRTSAMLYKGVRKSLREIARELEVDAIVEGTVLRAGHRVRITAQLIDPMKETHLWAESYERDLRNVLALQSEVAQAIAREIKVKLTPQERAQLAQVQQPVEPEAYEAYLKGRYYWNRRNPEGLKRAVQYFEQAIEMDPTYAVGYAGLADGLSILALWSLVGPEEGCGKAKRLALRALEIDGSLAEAYASLAWATTLYDYNFSAAEREFERSIELDPRYATAREWFGLYLSLMGRYEEAYTEVKRAIRLDPCSSVMRWALGFVYWRAHRYDQAIEEHDKALELDPNFTQSHWGSGVAHLDKGAHEPAIAALRKARELSQGAPIIVGYLGAAYAASGQRDEAQQVLDELQGPSKRYVSPYLLGRICAALGQRDEALRWLETAYLKRAEWMALLRTEAGLDNLRADARFQHLMRRMNFP